MRLSGPAPRAGISTPFLRHSRAPTRPSSSRSATTLASPVAGPPASWQAARQSRAPPAPLPYTPPPPPTAPRPPPPPPPRAPPGAGPRAPGGGGPRGGPTAQVDRIVALDRYH